jgi:amino acid adenylation domain-containing protein
MFKETFNEHFKYKNEKPFFFERNKCMHQFFEEYTVKTPNNLALVFKDETLTYQELNNRANQLANYLISVGVGPEIIVGICVDRSVEMIVGILGILKAGGAYLPLDPEYPEDRLSYMLEDADLNFLLLHKKTIHKISGGKATVVNLDTDQAVINRESAENPCRYPDPKHLAYVIYTSGSTGSPKGVMVEHRGLPNLIKAQIEFFEVHPGSRILQLGSLGFDASLWEIIMALCSGSVLCMSPKEDLLPGSALAKTLNQHAITHLTITPSALSVMDNEKLTDLKVILAVGERCPPEIAAIWSENCQFINGYGVTEATMWTSTMKYDRAVGHLNIGFPMPNTQLYILDSDLQILPPGDAGELHISGISLARGYLNQPELTKEKFIPNPFSDDPDSLMYKTGDLCRFLPDGNVEFLGRIDFQTKISGHRIEPEEIEAELCKHPATRTATVIVREDIPGDKRLVAYLLCREKPVPVISELRTFLKQKLPEYMIPSAFVMLDKLPITPNGKVDRRALPAPDMDRSGIDTAYASPSNWIEKLLVELWQETLGIKTIGIHDNFFELGGDSIKAVMVINKLQNKMNSIFHPVAIFDAPTISDLANYFKENYPKVFNKNSEQTIVTEKLNKEQIDYVRQYLRNRLSSGNRVQTDLSGKKNKRAIFILSPARSGSTLLRVILGGNPELFSPPELYLLSYNTLKERKQSFSGRTDFIKEGLIRAVMEIRNCDMEEAKKIMAELEDKDLGTKEFFALMQAWLNNKIIVDKTPPYAFNPQVLQRAEAEFENPLYIHLLRHPAGMVFSFEEARVDLGVAITHENKKDFSLSARQKGELWWLISHENINAFLKNIPEERKQQIKFEDLVKNPEAKVRELCKFLNVNFYPDMLMPQKDRKKRMTDGVNPLARMMGDPKFHTHKGISSTAADRWKKEYKEDFLCDDTWELAKAFGYEKEIVKQVSLLDFQIQPVVRNRHEPFPLTDTQEAYWAGQESAFELGGNMTHGYAEVDCVDLDFLKFNMAWQKLINRHDMLRAVILPDGRQQILNEVPDYKIKILDLRELNPDDLQWELKAIRKRLSHQMLSSDKWPLFDIRISHMDNNHFRIHFSFYGLIFDARSRYIVFSELERLYNHPQAQLPPLEISFEDYVLMTEKIKESELYEQSRDYWLRQISILPGMPELPLSTNPASISKPKFIQKSNRLDKKSWDSLKAYASKINITPSCLLLTVFSDIIRCWNKLPAFTINLTIFNRLPLHPQVNDLVGDFTSILLVEIDDPENNNFTNRARQLQKRLWTNLQHRFFTGIEVLREIAKQQKKKPGAHMPVVMTSVLSDEIQTTERSMTGWLGKTVYSVAQTPQVWLDHVALEEDGNLILRWNIVEELFPKGLMDDMFHSYVNFLKRLALDNIAWNETWHETTIQLLPQYQKKLYEKVNATRTQVPEDTLHSLFISKAKQKPENIAVVSPYRSMTYKSLYENSNQIGNKLIKMGASPNRLVAVVMEKGWEQVAAVMGILASGAAYLPIDPGLPEERLFYLLDHGKIEIVLTQPWLSNRFDWPNNIQCLTVDDDTFSNESTKRPEISQKIEDLAYVIFTSGSTGLPKGVMIDHRGAVNTILDINKRFDVSDRDSVLALSSLNFDLSVYDIFGILAAGGTVVMPKPSDLRDPSKWAKRVNDNAVTIWNTVPSLMGLLSEYVQNNSGMRLDSLNLILMSGDWIPPGLPEKIRQITDDPKIISLGGATEASIWSILYPIEDVDPSWKSIPYGKPMTNQQFHVLNDVMELCPIWVPGMLYIGGIGLAKGYWGDKEKTDKAFIIHPSSKERLYCTGDMGRYLPDGNIEFLGREDFQVKIQGFRVELGEIESALTRHPDIQKAVVEARGERHAEKHLFAYIVPACTPAPLPNDLRLFLKTKLPEYMLPSVYVALDKLPLTANGKIDRKSLPEPSCEQFSTEKKMDIKSSKSLTTIASIVEQILGTEKIEYEMNLLDLGATSIHVIRIANQMEAELGFRPEIDDFYRNPCIQQLARAYEEAVDQPWVEPGSEDAAISGCPENMLKKFAFIADPDERQAFKDMQQGIRHLDKPSVELLSSQSDDIRKKYELRRSYRRFSSDKISFENFSEFLSCMRQGSLSGNPKYLYASAGGTYPVQMYLYIKPERVESVEPGIYYYHPEAHRLMLLSSNPDIPENIYDTFTNRPIFTQAAFGLFLIAQMEAIIPLYKERSLHYAVIEAGLISQLLETFAPDYGLGLCQIGNFDFHRIKHLFELDETHLLVHSLLGGIPDKTAQDLWTPVNEFYHMADADKYREEGEL